MCAAYALLYLDDFSVFASLYYSSSVSFPISPFFLLLDIASVSLEIIRNAGMILVITSLRTSSPLLCPVR